MVISSALVKHRSWILTLMLYRTPRYKIPTGKATGNGCETVVLVLLRATQIKTYSWGNAQVVLVGNKVDLEEERQVPTEDAQRLATELGKYAYTHST